MTLDLPRPLICLITTGECEAANYPAIRQRIVDLVAAAVDAGVDLIQLREKNLCGKLLFELTQQLAKITHGARTKLLVNDRTDVALAAGADGVHLTSTSIRSDVVRAHVPEDFVVGVSCHSAEGIRAAATGDADFVLYGPVFASPGKGDGVGLEALAEACGTAGDLPVLAVGGIDVTNCRSAIEAGAAGVAAIRTLNDVDSMISFLGELGR